MIGTLTLPSKLVMSSFSQLSSALRALFAARQLRPSGRILARVGNMVFGAGFNNDLH
jgi:hypothetical protein